jgi:cytochrome c-type biogenesis protein CcmE
VTISRAIVSLASVKTRKYTDLALDTEAPPHMRKRSQRLWLIGAAALLLTGAVALAVVGFRDSLGFFRSPTDIVEKGSAKANDFIRVGGLVEVGSRTHNSQGELTFTITDGRHVVPVVYDGIPPDLFQEGQGVVAEGKLDDTGKLVASRVIAKHDENYMPKEVYDALKKGAEAGGTTYTKEPTT